MAVGGSSRCRAPPLGLSTTPMRRNTVRMPASTAGVADVLPEGADIGDEILAGLSSSRMQQSRQLP